METETTPTTTPRRHGSFLSFSGTNWTLIFFTGLLIFAGITCNHQNAAVETEQEKTKQMQIALQMYNPGQ